MSDTDIRPKKDGVDKLVEAAWKAGKVWINSTKHSSDRSEERKIDTTDLRDVILYGYREEGEDIWKEERGHWAMLFAIKM